MPGLAIHESCRLSETGNKGGGELAGEMVELIVSLNYSMSQIFVLCLTKM